MFLILKKALRFLKYIFLILIVLFLLLVGIINLPFVHQRLTSSINKILQDNGIPAHVGKVSLLVTGEVGIEKLEFIAPGNDTIVYAETVEVSIGIIPLIHKKLVLQSIGLHDVTVNLSTDSLGTINLLSYFTKTESPAPADSATSSWEINAGDIHLTNCSFRYDDAVGGIFIRQQVQKADLEMNEFSILDHKVDVEYLGLENCIGSFISGPSKPDTLPSSQTEPWTFIADEVSLKNIAYSYKHTVSQQIVEIKLQEASMQLKSFDLIKEEILVSHIRLESPDVYFDPGKPDSISTIDTTTSGFGWKLLCNEFVIKDAAYAMKLSEVSQSTQSFLPVRKFSTTIKNISWSPSSSGFDMQSLSATLGKQAMIQNARIRLEADSLLKGKVSLSLDAALANNNSFHITSELSGSSEALKIDKCNFSTLSGIEFTATGFLTDVINFPNTGCQVDFFAKTGNTAALKNFVAAIDPAIEIPTLQPVTLKGNVANTFSAPVFSIGLHSASGQVGIAGKYDFNSGASDVHANLKQVQTNAFFGDTYPQQITGTVAWKGVIRDLTNVSGEANITVDSISYHDVVAHEIQLSATILNNKGELKLDANDPVLRCNVEGDFAWKNNSWSCKLQGPVSMNEAQTPLLPSNVAVRSDISTSVEYFNNELTSFFSLENLIVANKEKSSKTDKLSVNLNMAKSHVSADVSGDFITGKFNCKSSFEEFSKGITSTGVEKLLSLDSTQFLNAHAFSMLPTFALDATIQYDSLFSIFYPDTVLKFNDIRINLYKNDEQNIVRGDLKVDEIHYQKYTSYGMAFNLEVDGHQLKSNLKIDSLNLNGASRGVTEVKLDILPAAIRSSALLTDAGGEPLYRLSVEALKQSHQVVFRSTSTDWIINAENWNLTNPQFLVWEESTSDFNASLNLKHEEMHIILTGKKSEQLLLQLENLKVSGLVTHEMMEGMPDGLVNAKITYSAKEKDHLGVDLDVKNFSWKTFSLAHFTAKGELIADSSGVYDTEFLVQLNDSSKVSMSMDSHSGHTLKTSFKNVPLAFLEPFTEEYVNGWEGYASGELNMATANETPLINGEIRIRKTALNIVELKSRFFIPEDKIRVKNSLMYFENFVVLDSSMKKLRMDGTINLENTEKIIADLKVSTEDLKIMNTTVADNPAFFGSMVVNSSLSITGNVSNPEIKGNVSLEDGTNITYRHIEDLSVKETQKVVTFAKFNSDSLFVPPVPGRVSSMSTLPQIATKIEINPKSRFNFEISSGYDISVSITGSGLLDYTMLPNNSMSLTGTYEINDGTTKLKFSGWPLKYFTITPGSSVRWDGDPYDPQIHLEATSKVRGSYINPVDNKSRTVDFIVFMRLNNQLSQLEVAFDVRSDDQYISSVLNTLSEDERMRQAINLLLFESINLPNIESSSNYMASQINSFWESQLNSISKTNLKYVDLSFGVDTYTQQTASGGQEDKTSLTYTVERKFMNDRASIKVSGRLNDEDPSTGSSGNSMLENFIFEYALDSLNRKFLKLYTKKDYEDILDGEVTKSGVGFIYRKTYPKFRDIWVRKKNLSTIEK